MSFTRQHEWRLAIHDVLASTSDHCRARAAAGEPEGYCVLARRQTQGRGSRGRSWESPSGNLHLSLLLRPRESARESGQWSLLAGVALAETLAPLLPDPAALSLKWPNDVLLAGRKLAGVLVDSAADAAGALLWLVIGIGVNLAVAPELPDRATACLAEVASPPAPEAFARGVLASLAAWRRRRLAEGFGPVRTAWLARAPAPGSELTLRLAGRTHAGAFAGLAQDGSLILQAGGRLATFGAGEVLA